MPYRSFFTDSVECAQKNFCGTAGVSPNFSTYQIISLVFFFSIFPFVRAVQGIPGKKKRTFSSRLPERSSTIVRDIFPKLYSFEGAFRNSVTFRYRRETRVSPEKFPWPTVNFCHTVNKKKKYRTVISIYLHRRVAREANGEK